MEEQSILTQAPQPSVRRSALSYRWMRYFFTEDVTPDNRCIVDLQRRAVWIGVALVLLSLNELGQALIAVDHTNSLSLLAPFTTFFPFPLTLGGFFAMWIAFRTTSLRQQARYAQDTRRHAACWQKVILVLTLILAVIGGGICGGALLQCLLPPSFSNDGTSLDTNAAMLLLQGRNPYTDSSILDVAHRFAIQPGWTTPLREGQFANRLEYPSTTELRSAFDTALKSGQTTEFESKVSYPALSFLTLVPFVIFGHYNVFPFFLLSYLLIIVIAWKMARPELRPWALLLAMANVPMWDLAFGGNLDIFTILLVILAWFQRSHLWSSVLFLGLAAASKQVAWLFVPFYMIMVWRDKGLKEALLRTGIAGSLALAVNAPFIIWNPQAWLAGILAPIADPMFPQGIGIIRLSIIHLLPYLPYWTYAALEGTTFLASLLCYWHICRQRPEAAMVLAVIPLLFAWRSLPSYFCCAAYPLFILMTVKMKPNAERVASLARIVSPLLRAPFQFLPQFLSSITFLANK